MRIFLKHPIWMLCDQAPLLLLLLLMKDFQSFSVAVIFVWNDIYIYTTFVRRRYIAIASTAIYINKQQYINKATKKPNGYNSNNIKL